MGQAQDDQKYTSDFGIWTRGCKVKNSIQAISVQTKGSNIPKLKAK
jgi:hypothetical protein